MTGYSLSPIFFEILESIEIFWFWFVIFSLEFDRLLTAPNLFLKIWNPYKYFYFDLLFSLWHLMGYSLFQFFFEILECIEIFWFWFVNLSFALDGLVTVPTKKLMGSFSEFSIFSSYLLLEQCSLSLMIVHFIINYSTLSTVIYVDFGCNFSFFVIMILAFVGLHIGPKKIWVFVIHRNILRILLAFCIFYSSFSCFH